MISLLIFLVIFGFVLYMVKQIPMDATVRNIITAVAILMLVIWLLQAFVPGGPHYLYW